MSGAGVPEELVKFAQALGDDGDLRAWFESLATLPDAARAAEFRRLAAKMHAAGEHEELVNATAMLAHPEAYRAVAATLIEIGA